MTTTRLSRRSFLRSMALTAPLLSLGACDGPDPGFVAPGFEEDALLLERYYSPDLIPQLQAIGMLHASGQSAAEVQQMVDHAVELLRVDPDEETAFEAIDAMITDDFRSLRIEDVAGWTLSRSQTHLAVLSLALV